MCGVKNRCTGLTLLMVYSSVGGRHLHHHLHHSLTWAHLARLNCRECFWSQSSLCVRVLWSIKAYGSQIQGIDLRAGFLNSLPKFCQVTSMLGQMDLKTHKQLPTLCPAAPAFICHHRYRGFIWRNQWIKNTAILWGG